MRTILIAFRHARPVSTAKRAAPRLAWPPLLLRWRRRARPAAAATLRVTAVHVHHDWRPQVHMHMRWAVTARGAATALAAPHRISKVHAERASAAFFGADASVERVSARG